MLKNSSVSIAKNRLRTLVISDRVQCTPWLMNIFAKIYTKHFPNIWNLQKMIFR